MAVYYGIILAALVLAYRNLRLRRGDRRGALRLATFVAAVATLGWICTAHHAPGGFQARTTAGLGGALYSAAVVYALYLAFEPMIRRARPRLLVSWTRLLAGRYRDPLVARDVLVGLALPLAYTLVTLLYYGVQSWRTGGPGFLDSPVAFRMESMRHSMEGLTTAIVDFGLVNGLLGVTIYVALYLVTRRNAFAVPLAMAIIAAWGTFFFNGVSVLANVIAAACLAGIIVWIVARFGLLANVVAGAVFHALWFGPVIGDVDAWYFGHGVATVAPCLVLGVLAARWAVRAPPHVV